jgi:hypothetical protein
VRDRDLPESASVNPTGECAASAARRNLCVPLAVEKRIDTGVRVATKENMDSADMKDVLHPDLSQWLKP